MDTAAATDNIWSWEFSLFISILAVVLAAGFLFLSLRKKVCNVLLVGLCDSGKTTLFTALSHNSQERSTNEEPLMTVTTTKEQTLSCVLSERKQVKLVDLPGHERLRYIMLDQYKNTASAIMFVIDSSVIQKDIKEVAGWLYEILSDRDVQKRRLKVLVVCNKQDIGLAKSAVLIQKLLEKEISMLRLIRQGELSGLDGTAAKGTFLGNTTKDFEFSDIKSRNAVSFLEVSCSAFTKPTTSHSLGGGDSSSGNSCQQVKQWLLTSL